MKTITLKNFKIADSFLDQLLGLLRPNNPRTMVFKSRFGIHTFLMSKPIDVLILDSHQHVVTTKSNLLPNRVFFWNPKYALVVELPVGVINKLHIRPGDSIKW